MRELDMQTLQCVDNGLCIGHVVDQQLRAGGESIEGHTDPGRRIRFVPLEEVPSDDASEFIAQHDRC